MSGKSHPTRGRLTCALLSAAWGRCRLASADRYSSGGVAPQAGVVAMPAAQRVSSVDDLPPGRVVGVGRYAIGNRNGEYFAVTRRCRHLGADLAGGKIDENGCLVCPWHHSAYDVRTGRMVRGPQGIFAKVPGLGAAYRAFTRVLPLRGGQVLEREGCLFVR